ncbi:concanavalin A-like lectin/glucanase domain-containing protein [Annulohypoxylon maeteangense]|uniref:concanavalin A-like lectin/glucanase domain-containing protein n=1 Tax=Annulohypoxylon maeteangense TaxID=1927788 RepID=UPI0020085625|nr:concanavalin A-like lectin/glucanase domain-containing protein [Annulohypoxylon maeteangense]KAI0881975.1 concanavalin A-like lectin/glucanase domain-containing protein [Annulohypoxylon maeteangense]
MPKGGIISLLTALGLTAQFVSGQLEPECNPLHATCQPNKAWSKDDYHIDFTKQRGPPSEWTIGSSEAVKFTSNGAEFSYARKGDAPNMWTDFYMLGGRYDIEMKVASGKGVISSATLWSDTQDEIDYDFSGNQFGQTPFPPKDGMWALETNVFAQGKMWDGAATQQKESYKPSEQFHKYSVEWDETHIHWFVDDKIIRQVHAKDTPAGFTFPQSPMKLNLGVWGAGEPGNDGRTIQWAGGEINMRRTPYTLLVKSVNITNKYPACQYKYQDNVCITYLKFKCHSYSSYSLAQSSEASPASLPASSHATTSSSADEYPTYQASSPSAKPSSSSEGYPTSEAESPSSSHLSASSGYPTSNAEASSAASPATYPAASVSSESHLSTFVESASSIASDTSSTASGSLGNRICE